MNPAELLAAYDDTGDSWEPARFLSTLFAGGYFQHWRCGRCGQENATKVRPGPRFVLRAMMRFDAAMDRRRAERALEGGGL